MSRWWMVGVLGALSGCVTAENFTESATATACSKAEQCDRDAFDDLFDDQQDCRETFAFISGSACQVEHCGFDDQAANACLNEVRGGACGEDGSLPDAPSCDEVYTDCAPLKLAACLLGLGE